jgi:hypothetical protein
VWEGWQRIGEAEKAENNEIRIHLSASRDMDLDCCKQSSFANLSVRHTYAARRIVDSGTG